MKIMRSCLFLLLFAFFALSGLWLAGLRVNVTASLPLGLYRLCPGTPGKGDYVSFCLEGEYAQLALERGYVASGSCPSGLRPLLKQVAGLHGDVAGDVMDAAGLHALEADSLHRPLASALRDGRIPPGMALVLSPHGGSFDGRYFGLVPVASLQRVEPVLVFHHSAKGEIPMRTDKNLEAAALAVMEQLGANPTLAIPVDEDVAAYMGLSEEKAVSAEDFAEDGLLTFGPGGAVYDGEE
ncbi:conjugative transfer signal peptidase TraF [Desulfovibrio sp. OttesenSCG-928-I05]|nr:conjugative transfer signal peptidase TraF [Desulfovibrio sp. OttesenSCG-928-O18]MDL2271419.1 conjugative transfer signal peptidase TraF [Desulfovibrio sp. OttesenSCG-928-I05]